MSPDEVDGDNLQEYILTAGHYFANRAVARYFNENLEPSNPENLHCLVPGTLAGYMGKHLLYIRTEIAPNHPDFANLKDDEYPAWYTSFRTEFENACNRFQINHQGDEIFSGHDITPLYRQNDSDKAGNFPEIRCDLKHVMLSLHKKATPRNKMIEHAALICDTADSVARPSESKNSQFPDWSYDLLLQMTNTPVRETKTLKTYGMGRICDESFVFDWYFNMGAYWMCEDGLARNEDQIRKGQMNSVFPSLQDVSTNTVAKKITGIIRGAFPDGVDDKIRKRYSARSLRKGMITEMCMSSLITLLEVCARSGHSTGTSLESYMDIMNPLRSLPGANALHGNPLRMKPVMPRMDAVGAANRVQVEKLMDALFTVDVPDFKPQGRLNIILEICFASLVRHLPEVLRLCGGHCLVASTLFNAAEKISLTDPRFPTLDPKAVLLEWSKMVGNDYKGRFNIKKLEVTQSSSDGDGGGVVVTMLSQIASKVNELTDSKKETELELAQVKAYANYQEQQIEALKKELSDEKSRTKNIIKSHEQVMKQFYPSPHSSPHSPTPKRRREDEDVTMMESGTPAFDFAGFSDLLDTGEEKEEENETAAIPEPAAAKPSAAKPAAKPPAPAAKPPAPAAKPPAPAAKPVPSLAYTNAAFEIAEGKDGNRGEYLHAVLTEMSRAGMLTDGRGSLTKVPRLPDRWKRHQASLVRCLGLVAFAGDEDDISILANGANSVDYGALKSAAFRLQTAAHGKLLEFENSSVQLNECAKKSKKPLILGMAPRILTYKKRIAKAMYGDEDKHKQVTNFMEVEELRQLERENAPGTPDDHRNVLSYYSKASGAV
jgi:hypothetical protein